MRRRISSLRSMLRFRSKKRELALGELPSVKGMRPAQRLPKALSQSEMSSLLESPDVSSPQGLRDRMLLELIYGAGLRVSEAVELRLEQLVLDSAAIQVLGKRGKVRWIPLPTATLQWADRYLLFSRPHLVNKPSALLILSNRGLKLLRQNALKIIQTHATRAGIASTVSPHTLRHSYAVHLLQGGADLRSVQELLGHESISTTQIYTQLDLEAVRRAYTEAHPRK